MSLRRFISVRVVRDMAESDDFEEFVVAASHVLDERVTADHDRRGPIRS